MIGRHLSWRRRTSSPSRGRTERRLRTSPRLIPRRVSRLRGHQSSTPVLSNAAVIRPSFLAVIARLLRPCLDRMLFLQTSRPSLLFRRRRRCFQRRHPRDHCRLYRLLHPICRQQGPTRIPSPPSKPDPAFPRRRSKGRRLLPPAHRSYYRRRTQNLLEYRNAIRLPERDCRAPRSLSRLP